MVDIQSTILVVEDEAGPRAAYKVILSPFYHVHVADSAEDAAAFMLHEKVDLVVLDLRLGGMNGLTFLAELRGRHDPMPVIVITGYGTLQTTQTALRLGASYHLRKPFDIIELLMAIQDTLKRPDMTEV